MYSNIIELPDGTRLSAGSANGDAIIGLTFTETVNNGTELMPGCAGVGEISFEIFATNGAQITAGDKLTWYKDGVLMGHFWAEKPTRATARTYKVIAYDAMAKTEKDLSPWLRDIQDRFPISLLDFARQVCEQCGLELVNTELPNGDYQIQQFYSDGMTARQLLVWVGQACGRFCRATPEGKLKFAWYQEASTPISGSGSVMAKVRLAGNTLRVADRDAAAPPQGPEIYRIAIGAQWYYADGLSYEDYETALIDKVQINQSADDVGVIVPPDATGNNALVLSGNLLLTTEDDASLRPVAEVLFEQFKDISYTPFKVTLPADSGFRAGDIVLVTDANGKGFQSYVMSAKISGGRVTLESTGSATRTASTAVNYNVQKNLRGKMLEIQSTVDGLKITASELSGNYTQLEQTVEGLTLTAENGDDKSVLSLKAGETTLSSAEIVFAGTAKFVTRDQLSTAGETEINGGNIKTGIVQNYAGTTIYDLESGTIQMGSNAGPHVKITDNMIRWYLEGGSESDDMATGIFYSILGNTWIGATSTNTYYGWMPGGTPGTGDSNRNGYHGLRLTHETWPNSVAHFNTTHVECGGEYVSGHGYFEAYSAKINGSWIGPQAASLMVLNTKQYGDIALTGTGSASPIAFDNGSGVLDETGKCWLFLTDEFASTVSDNVTPQWHITPTSKSDKPLTVQKDGLYAIVSGEPGTTFDWLCIMPQKGCETLYCEAPDFDMADGMDRKDYIAADELDAVEIFEQRLNDEVLTVSRENNYIEEIWPGQLERRA